MMRKKDDWRFTGLILLTYWTPAAIFLIAARYLGNTNEGLSAGFKALGALLGACGGAFACAFILGQGGLRGVAFLRRFYVPDKVPWLLVIGGEVVGVLVVALFLLLYFDWYRNDGLLQFGAFLALIFFFFVPAAGFFLVGAKKKQKRISKSVR